MPAFAKIASLSDQSACAVRISQPSGQMLCIKESQAASWFQLPGDLSHSIDAMRWKMREQIRPADPIGVIRSLILGESGSRREGQWLRTLGFVHLMSATGIHLYALTRMLLAIGVWGRWLSPVIWIWAWILSGFRWGTLRPLVIVALRFVSDRLGIQWRLYFPLVAAILVEFAAAAVFHGSDGLSGFLASARLHYALAVGGGLFAIECLERFHPKLKSSPWAVHGTLALGSWIFVAFAAIFQGLPVGIWTPVLSLVTIPWMAQILFPSLLILLPIQVLGVDVHAAITGLEQLTYQLLEVCVRAIYQINLQIKPLWSIHPWALAVGIFVAVVCSSLRLRNRMVLVCAILGLRFAFAGHPSQKEQGIYNWTQLNVGQGDSAWVQWNSGRNDLIDAGPEHRDLENWLKRLVRYGNKSASIAIDGIVLSHFDADHTRGIFDFAPFLKVGCVAADQLHWQSERGQRLMQELTGLGIAVQRDALGCWGSDQSAIRTASVVELKSSGIQNGGNAVMTGFFAHLEHFDLIALGDASMDQEQEFVRLWKDQVTQPLVYKVDHHGSCYSTGEAILGLKPFAALVSSGKNRYGHPCFETLHRLKRNGVQILRTDQSGDLSIDSLLFKKANPQWGS